MRLVLAIAVAMVLFDLGSAYAVGSQAAHVDRQLFDTIDRALAGANR